MKACERGVVQALGQSGTRSTLDTVRGVASALPGGVPVGAGDLDFGSGFNPVPDRLRVVTATDLSLLVDPNTGATVTDTPLAPAARHAGAGAGPPWGG